MDNQQKRGDVFIAAGLGQGTASLGPQEGALIGAGVAEPTQHVHEATKAQQQGVVDQSPPAGFAGPPHEGCQQLTSLAPVALDPDSHCGHELGLVSPDAAVSERVDRQGEYDEQPADEAHDPAAADHDHPSEGEDDGPKPKRPAGTQECPRCSSKNTKFCYYNNYNIKQPRYYCRDCQRYWTMGGTLRQIAPGAGRRKSKAAPARAKTSDPDAADVAPPTPSEAEAALYSPEAAAAAGIPAGLQPAHVLSPPMDSLNEFSLPLGGLPSAAMATPPQALAPAAATSSMAHQGSLPSSLQGMHPFSGGLAGMGPGPGASVLVQQLQQQHSQGPESVLAHFKQLLEPAGYDPAAAAMAGLGGMNPLLAASLLPNLLGLMPGAPPAAPAAPPAAAGLMGLLGSPGSWQTAALAAMASGSDPFTSLAATLAASTAAGQQQGQQSQIGAAMAALASAGLLPGGLDIPAAAAAAVQGGAAAAAAAAIGLFRPPKQQLQQHQLAGLASGASGMFTGFPGLPAYQQQQQQQQAIEQQLQQQQAQFQQQLQFQQLQQALQGYPQGSLPLQQQQQLMAQLAGITAAGGGMGVGGWSTAAAPLPANGNMGAASAAATLTANQTAAGLDRRAVAAGAAADPHAHQGPDGGGDGANQQDAVGRDHDGVAGDGSDAAVRRVRQRLQPPAPVSGQQQQQQQMVDTSACSLGTPPAAPGIDSVMSQEAAPVTVAAAPAAGFVTTMGPPAAVIQQQQQQGAMGPPPQKPPVQHTQQQQQQALMHQLQSVFAGAAAVNPSAAFGMLSAASGQPPLLQQLLLQQTQQQLLQPPWLSPAALAAAASGGVGGGLDPSLLLALTGALGPGGITALGPIAGAATMAAASGISSPMDTANDTNNHNHNNQQQQQQQQLPAMAAGGGVQPSSAATLAAALQAQAATMQLAGLQAQNGNTTAPAQFAQTLQATLAAAAAAAASSGVPGTSSWGAPSPAAPAVGGSGAGFWSRGPGQQLIGQQQQQHEQPTAAQQQPEPPAQQIQAALQADVAGPIAAAADGGGGEAPWAQQQGGSDHTALAAATYIAQQMAAAAAAAYPGMR